MNKKLSKEAYGGVAGKDYVPYITDKSKLGGNIAVLIIGIIFAAVFAASTAYSGMKAGLTVAAGIPGAILGSAFVVMFAKHKGILGRNLVQGMASGGESVASGLIFVLPSVILIGSEFTFLEGVAVGIGGVLFGIGAASLVYNYLIIDQHGHLMYPEAMAISETLVASENAGGDSMKFMGIGFGIGGVLNTLSSSFLNLTNNVMSFAGKSFYKWKFDLEVNPLLLGIGFIVGMDVSLTMFAGSILSAFGITPLLAYFAEMAHDGAMVWNNPSLAINQMAVSDIAGSYVKYIGAGMMLCGGIIGAVKLIPTIIASVKETMNAKSSSEDGEGSSSYLIILLAGTVIGLIASFIISESIVMTIVGAILSFILSLLFVIVAGRLTGTIGTSNLPVSGMTIASLVITTVVFVSMGWTSQADNKSLLLFGSFIVVAISIAGGYCQSQKVTFVVGGNKNEMQRYFTISAIVGVIVVVAVMVLLTEQLQITGDNPPFALPQANLMSTLTSGIMSGNLPWVMIIVGVFMAIVLHFLNLSIMTVAIGFYLPISTTSIILVGALVREFIERSTKNEVEKEVKVSNGISLSSGLVAGGSILGLIGVICQVTGLVGGNGPSGFAAGNGMAVVLLVILVVLTALPILNSKVKGHKNE